MQLNPARGRKLVRRKVDEFHFLLVYAAQPREGTETRRVPGVTSSASVRFMQLNPARGRKP